MSGSSILDEKRLTIPQAAERLGIGVSTVWKYIKRDDEKRVPSVVIAGRRFILERDLEKFVTYDDGDAE